MIREIIIIILSFLLVFLFYFSFIPLDRNEIDSIFLREKKFIEEKYGIVLEDIEYKIIDEKEICKICNYSGSKKLLGCALTNGTIYYSKNLVKFEKPVIPHEIMHIVLKCKNLTVEEKLCKLYEDYRFGYHIPADFEMPIRSCADKVFYDDVLDCGVLWERYRRYCEK